MPTKRKTSTSPANMKPEPVKNDVVFNPPAHSTPERTLEPEVVPDGDYAGMTYDEVLKASVESVTDAVGHLSIEGALATFDAAIGEALFMMEHYHGKRDAKEAGIKICETALPYAMLDISDEPDRRRSLAEARQAITKKGK